MMKKIAFSFFLMCFSTLVAFSQQLSPDFETYVFGDKVNVRSKPDKDAPVVKQLVGGDEITVVDTTPQYMAVNGRSDRFYKIKFGTQTGYLWGGLISYGGRQKAGDAKIVYNFTEFKKNSQKVEQLVAECRALRNGLVVAKSTANFSVSEENMTQLDSIDSDFGKIGNYKHRITISMGYPACGYNNYSWILLFDGTRLLSLEPTTSIADGGVFGYGERWIFPNDENYMPVEGKLRFEISEFVTLEKEEDINEYKMVRAVKLTNGTVQKRPEFPTVNFMPKKKIVPNKNKPIPPKVAKN
ncbi:MAG: hypothetical protein RL757_1271 [Bacteroidota bacterium]|jgi:hypothetical protein